jgi:predicted phage terminase large subunit-like protein
MAARVKLNDLLDALPDETFDALMRSDFGTFVRFAFDRVSPGVDLVWGRHLDLICAALGDVVTGKTQRLIITIPPRHGKSICGSVALPAFFLGHNPSGHVMVVSYVQDIARKFGEDTRKVMLDSTYKRIFPTRLTSPRLAPKLLRTIQGGDRLATSVDGVATALGADLLIFDDPQRPGEVLSDAVRRATNEAFENTFLSRLNEPESCCMVIIMQRLHEDDFVGHALERTKGWRVINLPAIAEEDEAWTFETFLGQQIWTRKAGEPLHPERTSAERLAITRAEVGEDNWWSQYQQRPTPAGGGLIKSEWFRRLPPDHIPPKYDRIIQSWDTANTIEEWSDYSVCTTWGLVGPQIHLLNVFRTRLEFPDLEPKVIELARAFHATTVLIENKGSGTQLLQNLRRAGFYLTEAVLPEGNKRMRMSAQTGPIANGFVYLPHEAHWVGDYLHELVMFPKCKYFDQVDSTSQALAWITNFQMAGWGIREFYRQESEKLGVAPLVQRVTLRPPPDLAGTLYGIDGHRIVVDPDRLVRVTPESAVPLLRLPGWVRVDGAAP